MPTGRIDVVVRCKNEMPWVERTLPALRRTGARILFVDSGSTDGSLDVAERERVEIVRIAPDAYVPGRVLNDAMRRTSSDIVAFVNADAIPLGDEGVARMVAACERGAAAAYGRQVARPTARRITRIDHARAFPERSAPAWRHFFSMAASAIRRDVWERLPFDDDLRYSEDVDWTFRLRALGCRIEYVPDAIFEHSHDYDAAGMRKRMLGEGQANAEIFHLGAPRAWSGFVKPLSSQIARDALAGAPPWESLQLRWVAQLSRFRGQAKGVAPRPKGTKTAARYTAAGAPADEARVQQLVDATVARVRERIGARALATLLFGSFACGEGAMEERGGERRVHNDLDFVCVVATRGEARALRAECRAIGDALSAELGATIDVWPAPAAELGDPRGRLLWVDAGIRGARVVDGAPDAARPLAALSARAVISGEVGRLLTNRATGLALSRLAFEAGADESATAARHVAKAWTALGDALLLLVDRYAPTSRERLRALEGLAGIGAPWVGTIAAGYADALAYRTAPGSRRLGVDDLSRACDALWPAFAALEAHRVGAAFGSPQDYADARGAVFDELPDVAPLARALGGARAALDGAIGWRRSLRHPRETLARASVVLAFEADRDRARRWAGRALGRDASSASELRSALHRLRDAAA